VWNRWVYWKKEAFPILLSGLKRLEYRGYDSFGFCVFNDQKELFFYTKKLEKSPMQKMNY
jgi:glucosamine--fructose-6-phosphate aminotransferase (isomerizing)